MATQAAIGNWLALAAVGLYLALALPQLGRPLTYDEVDFSKASRAIAGGTFRYDRGYIADYPLDLDSGQRLQLAIYHPPGYAVALAAWQAIAGPSDAARRAYGVACGLATLAATAALGGLAGGALAGGLAALIWASTPYAIQSALLLDIDGTVLAPTTAVFVWLALRDACAQEPERTRHRREYPGRHPRRDACAGRAPRAAGWSWWRPAAVALAFALSLWAKLTTPAIVAVLLVGWITLSGRAVAARRLAGACAAGAVLFGVTWWTFATAWGLPALRPFADLAYEVLDTAGLTPVAAGGPLGASGAGYVALRALVALLRSAQWLHPLFIGVLFAAPLALRRREPGAALLLVAALTMTLYLIKLAAGFPKYHAGVLPLAVAAAGVATARWLGAGRGVRLAARPNAEGAGLSVTRWRSGADGGCGVPLWLIATGGAVGITANVWHGSDALIRQAEPQLLAAWLAVATTCLVLGALGGSCRAGGLALGLLLGTNLALATHQARAGWSTAYFYGTSGQVAAGAWLVQAAAPGERVVADRDVAYYAGGVHYMDSERFAELVARGDGCAPAALTRLVVTRHHSVAALLPSPAAPAAVFGDYRAWRLEPLDSTETTRLDVPCART